MGPNPLEYAQNTFEAALNEAGNERRPLWRESVWRRGVAYGLKGVAVFGGLAIASGLADAYAHAIGIAIAGAVAVDGFFSNHVAMVLATRSAQAYDATIKRVRRIHQQELTPILELQRTDPGAAHSKLLDLLGRLTKQLHDDSADIEEAVRESRLGRLKSLSLDTERAAQRAH
jgi:hypothetical protein